MISIFDDMNVLYWATPMRDVISAAVNIRRPPKIFTTLGYVHGKNYHRICEYTKTNVLHSVTSLGNDIRTVLTYQRVLVTRRLLSTVNVTMDSRL